MTPLTSEQAIQQAVEALTAIAYSLRKLEDELDRGLQPRRDLEDLIAALSSLRAVQAGGGWMPIETAPKQQCLCFHPPVRRERPPYDITLSACIRAGHPNDWPNRPATHWMPIPPLPKETA